MNLPRKILNSNYRKINFVEFCCTDRTKTKYISIKISSELSHEKPEHPQLTIFLLNVSIYDEKLNISQVYDILQDILKYCNGFLLKGNSCYKFFKTLFLDVTYNIRLYVI